MRIAGMRVQPPVARLLAEILGVEGFATTSKKITEAIELQVTTEAPLTPADYEAILEALDRNCPSTLYDLHRRLREERRRIRYVTGG
jgi:hypothetical protein